MSSKWFSQEQEKALNLLKGIDTVEHYIVLYNDDYNTFDFVIKSLIDICDHSPHQAEQCTLIIHHNGKCDVKSGSIEDLKPRCKRLTQRGLVAEII